MNRQRRHSRGWRFAVRKLFCDGDALTRNSRPSLRAAAALLGAAALLPAAHATQVTVKDLLVTNANPASELDERLMPAVLELCLKAPAGTGVKCSKAAMAYTNGLYMFLAPEKADQVYVGARRMSLAAQCLKTVAPDAVEFQSKVYSVRSLKSLYVFSFDISAKSPETFARINARYTEASKEVAVRDALPASLSTTPSSSREKVLDALMTDAGAARFPSTNPCGDAGI
jgi:hypothetical protein